MWVPASPPQSLGQRLGRSLGKTVPIVHINVMSDQHDNPPDEPARATPQYRVRKPDGETSTPKSAQNTAALPVAAPSTGASTLAGRDTGPDKTAGQPTEIGGPKGLEPTRFGDWERDGRCVDF